MIGIVVVVVVVMAIAVAVVALVFSIPEITIRCYADGTSPKFRWSGTESPPVEMFPSWGCMRLLYVKNNNNLMIFLLFEKVMFFLAIFLMSSWWVLLVVWWWFGAMHLRQHGVGLRLNS